MERIERVMVRYDKIQHEAAGYAQREAGKIYDRTCPFTKEIA